MKQPSLVMGRRWPPALLAGLVAMWLLLNQSLSVGQIALGTLFAAALTFASASFRPLQPRLKRLSLAARLAAFILIDIVRSNIAVARIVLGLVGARRIRSGLVKIPLELGDPHGLAVLAAIVTATPGTVWVDFDAPTGTLTLHVLDLVDESYWVSWIKSRYERPLKEIFE